MNWTFHPKNKDLTTSLPLSVELTHWEGNPKVLVKELGELELKPHGKNLKADFYLTLPGTYTIVVKDSISVNQEIIEVKQHTYLDFKNEFGIFLLLFLIVMGGIVLWTYKIMNKKIEPT
jgi:hypothetical protein